MRGPPPTPSAEELRELYARKPLPPPPSRKRASPRRNVTLKKKAEKAVEKKKELQKPFPFLRLPAELRTMIHGYCLLHKTREVRLELSRPCSDRPRRRAISDLHWDLKNKSMYRNLNILRINKQMNVEGSRMLYGQTFRFFDTGTLQAFMLRLRSDTMAMLKTFVIPSWIKYRMFENHSPSSTFALIATNCPNLASLTIGVEGSRIHIGTFYPRNAFHRYNYRDKDIAIGKGLAQRLWMDCHAWVTAVVLAGGIDELKRRLHIHEHSFYDADNGHKLVAGDELPEDRRANATEAMFNELAALVKKDG